MKTSNLEEIISVNFRPQVSTRQAEYIGYTPTANQDLEAPLNNVDTFNKQELREREDAQNVEDFNEATSVGSPNLNGENDRLLKEEKSNLWKWGFGLIIVLGLVYWYNRKK